MRTLLFAALAVITSCGPGTKKVKLTVESRATFALKVYDFGSNIVTELQPGQTYQGDSKLSGCERGNCFDKLVGVQPLDGGRALSLPKNRIRNTDQPDLGKLYTDALISGQITAIHWIGNISGPHNVAISPAMINALSAGDKTAFDLAWRMDSTEPVMFAPPYLRIIPSTEDATVFLQVDGLELPDTANTLELEDGRYIQLTSDSVFFTTYSDSGDGDVSFTCTNSDCKKN